MPQPPRVPVGPVLRAFRVKRELTIEQAARRAELHLVYYGDIERAKRNPTVNSIDRILSALQFTWGEFGAAIDEYRRTAGVDL